MATKNPFATVALGQEGSGLAQVLTPYDSAKYDNAIVEQELTKRKEDAKALQDLKKDYKLGEMVDLDKGWEKDIDTYSGQFKELYNEEVSLFTDAINVRQINDYDTFLNESDKLTRRWAEHNKKAKLYNEDVFLSTKNKEIFDKAVDFSQSNQNEIDTELWDKRKQEFTKPPDYVMKEAGGDLQRARQKYLNDYCGGELVPQRFVHEDFQKKITALTAQKAIERGGGGTHWVDDIGGGRGGYVTSRNEVVTFNDDDMKGVVLANINNNKRALDYYREQPMLEAPLKEYTKKIGKKDVSELSYRDMYDFMAKDPAAMEFMRTQYFWNDKSKSVSTFSEQYGGGSGYGDDIRISDAVKKSNVRGRITLKGAKQIPESNLPVATDVSSFRTIGIGDKAISARSWTPSVNSRTIDGSPMAKTKLNLVGGLEDNVVYSANETISFKMQGMEYEIPKGEKIPDALMNNPNFVNENKGLIGETHLVYGTFEEPQSKITKTIYAPIEDFKSILKPDAYDYIINYQIGDGENTQTDTEDGVVR